MAAALSGRMVFVANAVAQVGFWEAELAFLPGKRDSSTFYFGVTENLAERCLLKIVDQPTQFWCKWRAFYHCNTFVDVSVANIRS